MIGLAIILFIIGCCVIHIPVAAIIVWGLFILVAIVRPILKRRSKKREEKELGERILWETERRMKEEQKKYEEEQKRAELMRRLDEFLRNQEEKENSKTAKNIDDWDDLKLDKCYEFLGVLPTDSMEKIKQAYKDLMVEFHPDKHGNYQEHYQELSKKINAAYEKICREREIK